MGRYSGDIGDVLLSSVVLPAPRKPESTVTGSGIVPPDSPTTRLASRTWLGVGLALGLGSRLWLRPGLGLGLGFGLGSGLGIASRTAVYGDGAIGKLRHRLSMAAGREVALSSSGLISTEPWPLGPSTSSCHRSPSSARLAILPTVPAGSVCAETRPTSGRVISAHMPTCQSVLLAAATGTTASFQTIANSESPPRSRDAIR